MMNWNERYATKEETTELTYPMDCLGCGDRIKRPGWGNLDGYCGADCLVAHLNRIKDGVEDKDQ